MLELELKKYIIYVLQQNKIIIFQLMEFKKKYKIIFWTIYFIPYENIILTKNHDKITTNNNNNNF